MIEKLKKFLADLNAKGIPIPTVRDPKTGFGSLTASMVVASFGVCVLLLAGKAANLLGGVDYDNALWLLGLSLSAYLGRQFQKKGNEGGLGGNIGSDGGEEGGQDAGSSK